MHSINLSVGWTHDGVRWVRRFGRPTGIDGARLLLTADFPAEAWLNGEPVSDVWPLDVTGKLLPRNELVLACGAVGAVALEIRPDPACAGSGISDGRLRMDVSPGGRVQPPSTHPLS